MSDTPVADRVAEAIIECWGERCPDYAPGCPCCDAWAQYDALTAAQERIEMAECAGFSAGYEAGQKDAQARIEALTKAMGTIEAGLAFIAVDATSEDARMAARLLPIARAALDGKGEGDGKL